MKAYFADREKTGKSGVTDIGACTPADIDRLLAEARSKGGAGSIAIGFSKSAEDFIEIDYVGKDEFLVQTDRLTGNLWQRLLGHHHLSSVLRGEGQAKTMIERYFQDERHVFESLFG